MTNEAPDYAFPHAAAIESRRLGLFQARLDPLTIRRIERIVCNPVRAVSKLVAGTGR
ncbi:MAG TPA: hypothetical protein VE442_20930 [Jatrophihabitans sp.]|nr:hypothetical protein [Jatrophihabitans sp.]